MHEVWSLTEFNHPAPHGYYVMVFSQGEDNYDSSKKLCLIVLITFRSFTNGFLGSCRRRKELGARRTSGTNAALVIGNRKEMTMRRRWARLGNANFKRSRSFVSHFFPSCRRAGAMKAAKNTFKTCIWHSNFFRQCKQQRMDGDSASLRRGEGTEAVWDTATAEEDLCSAKL